MQARSYLGCFLSWGQENFSHNQMQAGEVSFLDSEWKLDGNFIELWLIIVLLFYRMVYDTHLQEVKIPFCEWYQSKGWLQRTLLYYEVACTNWNSNRKIFRQRLKVGKSQMQHASQFCNCNLAKHLVFLQHQSNLFYPKKEIWYLRLIICTKHFWDFPAFSGYEPWRGSHQKIQQKQEATLDVPLPKLSIPWMSYPTQDQRLILGAINTSVVTFFLPKWYKRGLKAKIDVTIGSLTLRVKMQG